MCLECKQNCMKKLFGIITNYLKNYLCIFIPTAFFNYNNIICSETNS